MCRIFALGAQTAEEPDARLMLGLKAEHVVEEPRVPRGFAGHPLAELHARPRLTIDRPKIEEDVGEQQHRLMAAREPARDLRAPLRQRFPP